MLGLIKYTPHTEMVDSIDLRLQIKNDSSLDDMREISGRDEKSLKTLGLEDGSDTIKIMKCPENYISQALDEDTVTTCTSKSSHGTDDFVLGKTAQQHREITCKELVTELDKEQLTHIDTVNSKSTFFRTKDPVNEIEDINFSILKNSSTCNMYSDMHMLVENKAALFPDPGDTENTTRSDHYPDNIEHRLLDQAEILNKEDSISRSGFNNTFGADTDQIWSDNWEPTCTSDSWGESYLTDSQTHEFSYSTEENSIDQNSVKCNVIWYSQDTFSLDNNLRHTLVTTDHETQEAPLLKALSINQKGSNCLETKQEADRPQALFHVESSRNASTESSSSHKDNETNSSDLSEDEIANRRYGLLYHDVEAEKEEVSLLSPVCSLV
ncbi:uncharacterized protein LOC142487401 [Ascaphus truei]|uniref:uncharacterized protein LOC142487401 n=1 Tax=Ascaphus truei TaxID=8439 RepID=UPI003F59D0EB